MHATTIGVDLAKTVFQVAIANAHWHVVARRRFSRSQFDQFLRTQPAAHVVMETCGAAHFWARTARAYGHRVSVVPAHYVRPYVRRNKTDRTDAEAVLEALRDGKVIPVTVKTASQQELMGLHRIRQQWQVTRTARINAMRGLLQEHGVTIARGPSTALRTVPRILEDAEAPVPGRLRRMLALLLEEVHDVEARLAAIERELATVAADDRVVQRLMRIPGVGLLTATALVGQVGHIHTFRRARQFASWLGVTPREHSSAGRRRLGAISKQGDVYLRNLLTHGARAVLLAARRANRTRPLTHLHHWGVAVQARCGHNTAALAVANKLARIIWAVWTRDVEFRATPAPTPVAA
jgi:transposase